MPIAEDQIRLFLLKVKEAISLGNFTVINRDKNTKFLADCGITPREREIIILSLDVDDYEKGPTPDHKKSSEDIWIFRKQYLGIDIYIKLKLVIQQEVFHCICLSFHEVEQ